MERGPSPAWVRALVETLRDARWVRLLWVLRCPPAPAVRLFAGPGEWLARAWRGLDRRLLPPSPAALAVPAGPDPLDGLLQVALPPDGPVPPEVVGADLDLLLVLCGAARPAALCAAARGGVWRAEAAAAGPAAGLYEVLAGDPVSAAAVTAWTADPAGGRTVWSSQLATDRASPGRNRSRLLWRCAAGLQRALEDLAAGHHAAAGTDASPRAVDSPPSRPPGFLRPFAGFALRRLRTGLVNLCCVNQWVVRLGRGDPLGADLSGLATLRPPRGYSWADPFLLRGPAGWHLFVEEVEQGKGGGHIAAMAVDEDLRPGPAHTVLAEPYHVSYPFLMSLGDQLYLVPETSRAGAVTAYRCVEFPGRWERDRDLLTGLGAADATLLEHEGRWWLFACLAAHPGSTPCEELFLFHAVDPLNGRWQAHPRNPVVSDARCARPAGRPFWHRGALLRPAQDCSVRYGYAVRLQRILRLSPTDYAEEEAAVLHPAARAIATHTLNSAAGLFAVDAKVRRWRWSR
ncbi:MAG: hypothetical protein AB1505_09175 [Candidatus Latescibacterota bacterium]